MDRAARAVNIQGDFLVGAFESQKVQLDNHAVGGFAINFSGTVDFTVPKKFVLEGNTGGPLAGLFDYIRCSHIPSLSAGSVSQSRERLHENLVQQVRSLW